MASKWDDGLSEKQKRRGRIITDEDNRMTKILCCVLLVGLILLIVGISIGEVYVAGSGFWIMVGCFPISGVIMEFTK